MEQITQPVLVVGATGRFGGLVLVELARRGVPARALVRRDEDWPRARAHGATAYAVGDLNDAASLAEALRGAGALFLMTPAFMPGEASVGVRLVELARAAGVRRIVCSSVIKPGLMQLPNHVEKIPIEGAVIASGIPYVILNPTMTFQNLPMQLKLAAASGSFAEPYPNDTLVTRVDYRDVAEVAAIGLTEDRLDFGSFELCEVRAYDRREVATIMARVLGREVEAREIGFDEWAALVGMPIDSPLARGLRTMYGWYGRHDLRGNATTLRAILGREPCGLPDFLETAARDLGLWSP